MLLKFARRVMAETDGRILWKFACNFGLRGLMSMRRFKRRTDRGDNFPSVMFISVTTRCNLQCQGCWASGNQADESLEPADLDRIITQSKRRGNYFFGILGGEPLLYPAIWDVLGRHRDCYFQVFTNGTLITNSIAGEMRRLGNVTPLISIEGLAATSDERRGGNNVYDKTLAGLKHCEDNRLLIGVATSVCKSNIGELVTERFIRELIDRGVHYLWYYVYRPVGPNPTPELALTSEQIVRLRRFMVETRTWAPILIIDAYWDEQGRALCPAVAGISYHINPWGDVEPCPPIQFAVENACNGRDLFEAVNDSDFLRGFRRLGSQTTRGCILMERPDLLRDFVVARNARDTSGRGTALAELAAAESRPSHDMVGVEIPERHWFYRFVKKHWFFGFGAYG